MLKFGIIKKSTIYIFSKKNIFVIFVMFFSIRNRKIEQN